MPNSYIKLNKEQIVKQYDLLSGFYKKFLTKYGVAFPKLYGKSGEYTKDALVLVYLSLGYPRTKEVTKVELTNFIRQYYPDVPDVQQARHLGAQSGWWIVAGGRDNIVLKVKRGSYQLHTLEQPYPDFKKGHRITNIKGWEELKKSYHNRCATCGSEEGEPHLHWSGTKTVLQKSHMDPNKPLKAGNIIPQCQKCNRADRNRWVYDSKGRVIKLADANFVRNFDKDVKKKIYFILSKEFSKRKKN